MIMMTALSTDYTQALKSIKEAEEASNRAIEEKKKNISEQLAKAQEQENIEIVSARAEAESIVTGEVEKARFAAQKEAENLVSTTEKQVVEISRRKQDKARLKEMIENILLSEFKGA